jgi:hypothetical protein
LAVAVDEREEYAPGAVAGSFGLQSPGAGDDNGVEDLSICDVMPDANGRPWTISGICGGC